MRLAVGVQLSLSRLCGRGLGEGLLLRRRSLEQCSKDGFQHAVAILDHVAVPEAQQAIAKSLETRRALGIGQWRVLPAVKFDHHPGLDADEIGNVTVGDAVLPAELEAAKPPSRQAGGCEPRAR